MLYFDFMSHALTRGSFAACRSAAARRLTSYLLLVVVSACTGPTLDSAEGPGPRLYVLDGGVLDSSPASYQLADDEVRTAQLSIAAYLIEHPDGVLLFDSLGIADEERLAAGTGTRQTIVRPDGQERHVVLAPSLGAQLAEIGHDPDDVTHLAFSHLHWDHTANANLFARATWLVRPEERALMFSTPGGSARPALYAVLEDSETVLVTDDEHDVFGDGSVVLKAAPGHSPGHQVLFVDLADTGPVVLSGDLYHYPEERSLDRLPVAEMDQARTAASRREVEEFLAQRGATLWIGHDLFAHREQRKAPAYYD